MRKIFVHAFALWFPLLVATTGIFGFSYLAVQQNYRQSLNDPQIQMAEDAAASLARDYTPASLVPRGVLPTDMATSLTPWIVVYDVSGTPLESSAVLDGAPPRLPAGLFDMSSWRPHKLFVAPTGSETHVTWQPRPGVRQAVVLVSFNAPHSIGYVAVGRSMSATEDRIIALTYLAAVAWAVTAIASFIAVFSILIFRRAK